MRISVRRIQELVAADFGIPVEHIRSRSKVAERSRPRQVAMYLARELTPLSLPSIARIFERDHTTILHGLSAVERRMADDRSLALKIEARALLLQCEPHKTVDTKNIGFLGSSAKPPHDNSQEIHRGFNIVPIDDPLALAA